MESHRDTWNAPALPIDRRVAKLLEDSTLKSSGLFGEDTQCIPTLTFLSGDALGKELPLIQQQVIIGRGEGSDILIMDPSISRRQIRLTCRRILDAGDRPSLRVVLRDLGSKNGTLVNYRMVDRALLKPGDKICMGRVILKFEYRDLADQDFYEQIYRLATTDALTSLLNRSSIMRALSEEIVKRHRYPRRLSILLLDLDDFKSLNDTLGHLSGDRALQIVADALRRNLRRQDKAGRFGGDEFLLVLPETGLRGACALGERIRADLERAIAEELSLKCCVTASMGIAAYPADGDDMQDLVEHADVALMRAKARGKNRVERIKKTGKPRSRR